MDNYSVEYKKWFNFKELEQIYRTELESIKQDEKEIHERFYAPLSFGTAGLRGIMRAGINGMNRYTVAQTTQGLSELIKECGRTKDGVVIACDTRNNSILFSEIAACVLAANEIKVYLFDAPRPTPELSFAIRELNAVSGINITASHNPKEYNGYKVYWDDGAQLSPDHAKVVSDRIQTLDIFSDIQTIDYKEAISLGKIVVIGKEIDEKYLSAVLAVRISPQAIPKVADRFQVVYTPLHGTGRVLVPEVLKRAGLKHLYCVSEQMIPDGNFPTVKSPNPENKSCFELAIKIAEEKGCDLLIGTDPDADRAGIVVKAENGEYVPLTGNQVGALLIDYILERRKSQGQLPQNACVIKSIVSTELADKICKEYGVTLLRVLTGFKFIGEKIKEFESTHEFTYIFGFEESYGYLPGTYARDKDAVSASLLITEMAAYYADLGMNLYDALLSVYEKYGYYIEDVENIQLSGSDGIEKSKKLMKSLREKVPDVLGGVQLDSFSDYLSGKITQGGKTTETGLPSSDVLYYTFVDGNSVVVRPSGTEPKVKVYYMISGKTSLEAKEALDRYKSAFSKLLD